MSVLGCSTCIFSGTRFRFRMRSVVSSIAPGMGENSCSTPSTRTAVMAAPSIYESSTRRRALPTVVANPRSNGWAREAAEGVGEALALDFEALRLLESFPKHGRVRPLCFSYFEYSSTMSCSWIGKFTSSRAGMREHLALHRRPHPAPATWGRPAPFTASWASRPWHVLRPRAAPSVMTSPTSTWYEGMLTFLSLTRTWPWRTSCRAWSRDAAEAQPVDHVVEAPLELAREQVLAHDALLVRRARSKVRRNWPLQHAVEALHLLLLAQLQAVALQLALDAPALAVLAGRVVALLDRALLGEAAVALQEQLHALAAAQPADGTSVSRHCYAPLDPAPLGRPATVVRDGRDVPDGLDLHSRRLQRADGRLAAAARALDADVERAQAVSPWPRWRRRRPPAAPRTGVPLRDPLNPSVPELDQATTFPSRSVMVTWVLLKEACTCAMPCTTCCFSFFPFLRRRPSSRGRHPPSLLSLRLRPSGGSWPGAGPCACARSCGCAARARAGCGGGASRGRSRSPSAA